ncbi:hypothetical protein BT96DRAFT_594944 [Gymnopus androsaceus JB14]|uniref:TRAPPC10/Trs130 N-terminal domain-containing protein n=1 Tax=Gymnopus androsaceus JB14 TaxID=1447944 RepID=A0A6A4GIH7_9AGAR|nr:hypothetical protein BT96DRAFT_594944 [Gymnopus androsaceus JB14]
MNKLRDGVLPAFEMAVVQREDEVRRSEGQRQMPRWNFWTFFVLKESLATSFEGVTLFDDALVQYEELEVSFDQILKEKNLSWFGTLITPTEIIMKTFIDLEYDPDIILGPSSRLPECRLTRRIRQALVHRMRLLAPYLLLHLGHTDRR